MSRKYHNNNKNHSNNNKKYNNYQKPQYNNVESERNIESSYNILIELKDYMFDSKNLLQFTKHTIQETMDLYKEPNKRISEDKREKGLQQPESVIKSVPKKEVEVQVPMQVNTNYYLKQKDSLFWCFFILKYGISKYEMEIGNQHFVVEKQEKFHYIETLRQNKELLKMHKIKPLSGIEDDLANKERISIKTFFALCIIENINILLVDKRKIYEIQMNDDSVINVVHRNSISYEHYIELDATVESITKYRETYFKVSGFEDTIKAMSAYKVTELMELCDKLGINIESKSKESNGKNESSIIKKTKYSKKDIYEFIVMNF